MSVIKQKNNVANMVASVKSDIAMQQDKSDDFHSEIVRLSVDMAAGYTITAQSATNPPIETRLIKPVEVKQVYAKDKY